MFMACPIQVSSGICIRVWLVSQVLYVRGDSQRPHRMAQNECLMYEGRIHTPCSDRGSLHGRCCHYVCSLQVSCLPES